MLWPFFYSLFQVTISPVKFEDSSTYSILVFKACVIVLGVRLSVVYLLPIYEHYHDIQWTVRAMGILRVATCIFMLH